MICKSGVKPQNHASMLSFEVPVLPAISMPCTRARVPVPRCTIFFSSVVIRYACSGRSTRRRSGSIKRVLPSLSVIETINFDFAVIPSPGNIEYIVEYSSGEIP